MARDHTAEAVQMALRLRRIERESDDSTRRELALVRDFIGEVAGRTVSRAEAARLLGVSQPALDRWIDKGEIASVLTPGGRREIPMSELIDLLDEVDHARHTETKRPLTSAIRERNRRSADVIDLDRLLPTRRRRKHHTAELQALAYHRLVAERLDEKLLDEARRRLRRWREEGRIDSRWADEWERILSMPRDRVARTIRANTPRARELRQTSPFAGTLPEPERRRLARAVEERLS